MNPPSLMALLLCFSFILSACGQHVEHPLFNYVAVPPGVSADSIVQVASLVVPTPRQIAWQELEFTVFLHFGMNTFTDKEWGDANVDPTHFNPTALDAHQWASVCSSAGARLMIIVAKHHDGFCLWPTSTTDYSVKKSPWKGGRGDVVGEVAAACRETGMKMGVYLSPWDISSPLYGTDEYNDHFRKQLTELLSNYGEISEVWFDGANGEGPNGRRQVYDWPVYFEVVRRLQPNAVIAIMGPDVRWVGTESGYGRETEWSVVPASSLDINEIAKLAQMKDLGSRERLHDATWLLWYPSEVDVSIRPGWFYHRTEDSLVKTPEALVDIYYSSIGRNSVLLLNIPPDRRGLLHENDVSALRAMRQILNGTFGANIAASGRISTSGSGDASVLCDDNPSTSLVLESGDETPVVEVGWDTPVRFDRLLLQENFRRGQRVEEFAVEAETDGVWKQVARGTTIGYKRLLRFEQVETKRLRLSVLSSRGTPELASMGVYKSVPGDVQIPIAR